METRNYFGYTVYEDGRILGKKGLFLVLKIMVKVILSQTDDKW